jgi:hypothetical protein
MARILLVLLLLTSSCFICTAQSKDVKFDRIRISHNGDSLIKQEYELIVKSKKVYFLAPFANYLHIKGGNSGTRVKFDKTKREKTFDLVNQLIWTNLQRVDNKDIKSTYFVIEMFSSANLTGTFKVADELLPPDFKELFDTLSGE